VNSLIGVFCKIRNLLFLQCLNNTQLPKISEAEFHKILYVLSSKDKVKEHLKQQAGIHFDPQVVEVFFKLLSELEI
jgi:hypothetical protein